MNSKWLKLAAGLLKEFAEADRTDGITGLWLKCYQPGDWTCDEWEELTRSVESWSAGTQVGDHCRTPFRFLVAGFLADALAGSSSFSSGSG